MLCQHDLVSSTARDVQPDSLARREQILDAALDVFGRQGFRQGSLKEVAVAVGLTVQGVLHHFPTKEALLMATLERRNAQRSARLEEVGEHQGVVAMMRVLLLENLEHPGFMRLFVTLAAEATDPSHPAHEYFLGRYRTVHDRLRSGFINDVRAGRAATEIDPDAAAEEVVALCDGLQLQYLLRPDMDPLATYDRSVNHLQAAPRPGD